MTIYEITAMIEELPEEMENCARMRDFEDFVFGEFYQKSMEMLDNEEKCNCLIFVTRVENKKVNFISMYKEQKDVNKDFKGFILNSQIKFNNEKVNEITIKQLHRRLIGSRYNDSKIEEEDIYKIFNISLDGEVFNEKVREELAFVIDRKTIEENLAENLLEGSFREEINRIYEIPAVKNIKGHPVHYLMKEDSDAQINKMSDLLVSALYNNGRVNSRRFTNVTVSEKALRRFSYHSILRKVYINSKGGTVAINIQKRDKSDNNYANDDFEEIIKTICKLVEKNRNEVLSIIVFPRECEKEKKIFYKYLENITFIEMKSDTVSGEIAKNYLKKKAEKSNLKPDEMLLDSLVDGMNISDLNDKFDIWYNEVMKTKIYSQYSNQNTIKETLNDETPKGNAFEKLNRLIGLEEAKKIIKKAIDFNKAQKLFWQMGMSKDRPSMHMVFTGNPGTAKTTVARLFAQIMKDNDILSKGKLYEVGRGDLVGKYVGWTAQIIKDKFKEAKGSVLFIDEAYSLVDDKAGMYGDEAINTIVQEMENNRDDTIVIFAGYPDKMEEFISRNPGLRSRIAFQVPFEDYDENELCEIAELIAEDENLVIKEDAKEKLKAIFIKARETSDFGNGRYARNIIENARMEQASRLVNMDLKDVTKDTIKIIKAEDIMSPKIENNKKTNIGF